MGAKDVFEAVGLGTPFYLAAATYGFFRWLDRNASTPATRAISAWLRSQGYRKIDIKDGIIGAFDHVYSFPLFRWKALFRSASLSIIVTLCYYLVFEGVGLFQNPNIMAVPLLVLPTNVLSDYLSLFIVRKCLRAFGDYPISSLFMGVLAGGIVVTISFVLILIFLIILSSIALDNGIGITVYGDDIIIRDALRKLFNELVESNDAARILIVFYAPALFVHFWLLLFALGGLGLRLLFPIFRAIDWARWFLKQGDRHPLQAIGMVAAVLVFAGTALSKVLVAAS